MRLRDLESNLDAERTRRRQFEDQVRELQRKLSLTEEEKARALAQGKSLEKQMSDLREALHVWQEQVRFFLFHPSQAFSLSTYCCCIQGTFVESQLSTSRRQFEDSRAEFQSLVRKLEEAQRTLLEDEEAIRQLEVQLNAEKKKNEELDSLLRSTQETVAFVEQERNDATEQLGAYFFFLPLFRAFLSLSFSRIMLALRRGATSSGKLEC